VKAKGGMTVDVFPWRAPVSRKRPGLFLSGSGGVYFARRVGETLLQDAIRFESRAEAEIWLTANGLEVVGCGEGDLGWFPVRRIA